jgi:hypothetical protein
MARRKPSDRERRRRKPATSPEEREQQIASKAYDLAEEQIEGGTASSQVITHFLKAGSTREQLEQQKIQHENELSLVKKEAMESQSRIEELYMGAIDAMRSYSGNPSDPHDEDETEEL